VEEGGEGFVRSGGGGGGVLSASMALSIRGEKAESPFGKCDQGRKRGGPSDVERVFAEMEGGGGGGGGEKADGGIVP